MNPSVITEENMSWCVTEHVTCFYNRLPKLVNFSLNTCTIVLWESPSLTTHAIQIPGCTSAWDCDSSWVSLWSCGKFVETLSKPHPLLQLPFLMPQWICLAAKKKKWCSCYTITSWQVQVKTGKIFRLHVCVTSEHLMSYMLQGWGLSFPIERCFFFPISVRMHEWHQFNFFPTMSSL